MITKISICNFKRFDSVEFELGNRVVLIGPNNSGKTTALQALALWEHGLKEYISRKSNKKIPSDKRSGVAINRRDIVSLPIPETILLWKDKYVKKSSFNLENGERKQHNENIRIEIIVEGVEDDKEWQFGLEFDYANRESFYCRPLRKDNSGNDRFDLPQGATDLKIAYLPPMSGLAAVEPKWEPGRINVLLGEGQTAQVLRNLCYQVYHSGGENWDEMNQYLKKMFGISLIAPDFVESRGEIIMNYDDRGSILDVSSSGRGFQQTVLLLAYLFVNPGSILLLDEPDAHLEILRQRQIYSVLSEISEKQKSQIIAASHSEILLNEAAGKDMVIAFVGKPHRIDDRGSQLLKSLKDIGFDQYALAEQNGWVLYLEGSTDLSILSTLAKKINHEASQYLENRVFVHYSSNQPNKSQNHFYALKEAKKDLVAIGIYDRLENLPTENGDLKLTMWKKCEIENYICNKDVLLKFATEGLYDDLFGVSEKDRRFNLMEKWIGQLTESLKILGKPEPWSDDLKVSDEFLTPLFKNFYAELGLPNLLAKSDYHRLASLLTIEQIDMEIIEKLDLIASIARNAKPA